MTAPKERIETQVNRQLSTRVAEDLSATCSSLKSVKYCLDLTNSWKISTSVTENRYNGKQLSGHQCQSASDAKSMARNHARAISSEAGVWRETLYRNITQLNRQKALMGKMLALGTDARDFCAVEHCGHCGGYAEHTCGNCHGEGSSDCGVCRGSGQTACTNCSGSGRTVLENVREQCSACFGSGHNGPNRCLSCYGEGSRAVYGRTQSCYSCGGSGRTQCTYFHCSGGKITCPTCNGRGKQDCVVCGRTGLHTFHYLVEVQAEGSPARAFNQSKSTAQPAEESTRILNDRVSWLPLGDVLITPRSSVQYSHPEQYPVRIEAVGELDEVQAELVSSDGKTSTGWFYGPDLRPLSLGEIGEVSAQSLLRKTENAADSLSALEACLSVPLFKQLLQYRKAKDKLASDPLVGLKIVSQTTTAALLHSYQKQLTELKSKRDWLSHFEWIKTCCIWLIILYVGLILLGSVQPAVYKENYYGFSALAIWADNFGWKFSSLGYDLSYGVRYLIEGAVVYLLARMFLLAPVKRTRLRTLFELGVGAVVGDAVLGYFGYFAVAYGPDENLMQQLQMWSASSISITSGLAYLPDLIAAAVILGYLRGYSKSSKRLKKKLSTVSVPEIIEDLGY